MPPAAAYSPAIGFQLSAATPEPTEEATEWSESAAAAAAAIAVLGILRSMLESLW